jgi:signal transduction histidine kinase
MPTAAKPVITPPEAPLIAGLNRLDSEVNGLRKTGEEINALSKELDKAARDRVEAGINLSQKAILVFFPAFLLVGIGLVFSISNNVVRRLKLLTGLVQRTMGGVFPHLEPSTRWGRDEVGLLIGKFGEMSEQLEKREAEIKAKNRELLQSKKLAAIGTLASGGAHEINNPLNNIYLSAQVLERQKQDKRADGETIIGDIIKETRRVRSIVGDLLEFAREGEPSLARTDAAALMKEAYSRVSEHFSETQKIDFSLEASGAPQGLFIDADPEQIERVFINILSNAVDAMQGTGHLLVDLCAEGGYAVIRVSDTGAGIAEEDLEKIFDPFYTTKEKGTGLGLAIVLNIIRKHGGEITVASAPGKGARFTIKLPLHKGGA